MAGDDKRRLKQSNAIVNRAHGGLGSLGQARVEPRELWLPSARLPVWLLNDRLVLYSELAIGEISIGFSACIPQTERKTSNSLRRFVCLSPFAQFAHCIFILY